MSRQLLALAACALLLPALAACGGDSDDGTASSAGPTETSSTPVPPNDGAASPTLDAPAGKYSISIEDLGNGYITDIGYTFVITPEAYSKVRRIFASEAEGMRLLQEWGYLGGYETRYSPEGGDTALLGGRYRVYVESHLFKDEAGAKKAFDHLEGYLKNSANKVNVETVGNYASGWNKTFGKIGKTSVDAAYSQYLTRRGNLMTIVLVEGADGFIKISQAAELARIADAKALGKREAVAPTPTSNYTPAATR